ncbi:hypothetical protein NUACC21_59310 [Scytonema sp. NUACC21]
MTGKLFLDALISREDFDVQDESQVPQGPHKTTLSYSDFKIPGFFFASLRKPDFQRETNEWNAEKVCDLIESFLDGDLIPAVILWKYADSYTFVIDGAHRISALAAWVNDDYGDGKLSRRFFDNSIPESQIDNAKKARELINSRIGAFKHYEESLFEPDLAENKVKKRLKSLGTRAIQLQWVDGDSRKAESSFFKINQKSTPISDTEIAVLESRRKPSGLCSRAILRGGQGYKYWQTYNSPIADDIQKEAEEINKLIFNPILTSPIKSLDLPLGGKNHAANSLSMIYELVCLFKSPEEANDENGEKTLSLLKSIRKALRRVNDIHPSSLGLHPAIYIYSSSGNFRVSCFHAVIEFSKKLEQKHKLDIFTKYRADFESILMASDNIIQQIVRKVRQANKAILPIVNYFEAVLDELSKGVPAQDVLKNVLLKKEFSYLTMEVIEQTETKASSFSKDTKSAAFIREAIKVAPRCSICNGLLHTKSIQIDHKIRKQDGGTGSLENAQLSHPYCNSTYKN